MKRSQCFASAWVGFLLTATGTSAAFAAVFATGGNSTNDIDGYRIHVFTNSGSLIVEGEGAVEVLVVAGGGGGGGTIGGGGGLVGGVYMTGGLLVDSRVLSNRAPFGRGGGV